MASVLSSRKCKCLAAKRHTSQLPPCPAIPVHPSSHPLAVITAAGCRLRGRRSLSSPLLRASLTKPSTRGCRNTVSSPYPSPKRAWRLGLDRARRNRRASPRAGKPFAPSLLGAPPPQARGRRRRRRRWCGRERLHGRKPARQASPAPDAATLGRRWGRGRRWRRLRILATLAVCARRAKRLLRLLLCGRAVYALFDRYGLASAAQATAIARCRDAAAGAARTLREAGADCTDEPVSFPSEAFLDTGPSTVNAQSHREDD